MDSKHLTDAERAELNQWVNYFSFKPTWPYKWLSESKSSTICLFSGNQFGKGASVAKHYVDRLIGRCPTKEKNFCRSKIRTIRFLSQTLPEPHSDGSQEVKNTQYPELKKWLPNYLIRRDITSRNPVLSIKDCFGGPDFSIEFSSYGQEQQSKAGQQRASIWIDESAPKGDYEESVPRLLSASQDPENYIADMILSFTPEPGCIGWEFDEFYERARFVNRTPSVLKRFYKRYGDKFPIYEDRGIGDETLVIMASSYDNPTYSKASVDKSLEKYDDEDVVDARGYGIFRQLSGKIFKSFTPNIHVIDIWKYVDVLPHEWKFFRGIDYHQHVAWAIPWICVTPDNEIFVYQEYNPDPNRKSTYEISREMCIRSGDYRFSINLVDPLAGQTQSNTGRSVVQDLNDYFMDFKKEGVGTGGWWEPWDTKNPVGRDEFRMRLKNSTQAGKPFAKTGLPTIWFDQSCQQTILSMKNWRIEEWANRESLLTKDEKDKPQQRFSHFPLAIECLLKRQEISQAKFGTRHLEKRKQVEYFKRPWV
jgi:hypothetical protein